MAREVRAADVFGISRDIPQNYVTRESVDGELVKSLTRDQHLVIYGSSKQGKTCLRKYHLKDGEYEVVTCSNKWTTLAHVHIAILKQAGYVVEQSTTRGTSGAMKVTAKAGLAAKILGKGVDVSVEGSGERGTKKETVEARLELDPADVNEVIEALRVCEFDKWIVLEDFHYLPEEVQKDFAVALKAFHEASDLVFIIVGVWLQENRLIQFNGDLSGRVTTINADKWRDDELQLAVSDGAQMLNIEFSDRFTDQLVANCYNSIFVVQEACLLACEEAGLEVRYTNAPLVALDPDPRALIEKVVERQSARYREFLQNFAGGFGETELQMYKWLLLPVLVGDAADLERGLTYRSIGTLLRQHHPRGKDLNAGNISQALKSTARLQVSQGVKPLVLDYDQSLQRLNVVDRSFLIWLGSQDKDEILELVDLPADALAA